MDNTVPIGQSEILLEALKKNGTEAIFQKVRSGHGGPGFEQTNVTNMVKSFFDQKLKGKDVKLEPFKVDDAPGGPR